jgi:thiamine biosynthesis lipoprotein
MDLVRPEGFGRSTFPLWGTRALVVVTEPAAIVDAKQLVRAETKAMDEACSRFRPDSELAGVNAAAGTPVEVGPLLAAVVSTALRAAAATAGRLDPTCGAGLAAIGYDRDAELLRDEDIRVADHEYVPAPGWESVGWNPGTRTLRVPRGCVLDFGLAAKALAVDRAAAAVIAGLGCGVLVSVGGDIAAAGPSPATGWQVKVADECGAGEYAAGQTITVRGGGVATSSTTALRWRSRSGRELHHILDPGTGRPVESCWRTVSVVADTCVAANIAATAALVCGEQGVQWLTERQRSARLVRHDGSVTVLGGWPREERGEI